MDNRSTQYSDDRKRWYILILVCAGVVLAMTTWFSATAVMPELASRWRLSASGASSLTGAVQLGFVAGALGASIASLPDIVSLRKLMTVSALIAAAANLSLIWVASIELALAARFVTGMALAGIYPPALKLIATWFQTRRGTALSTVIAALTFGSASPHLMRALTDDIDWRVIILATSLAAFLAAVLIAMFAAEGPQPFAKARFAPRQIGRVLKNRPLVLVNLGYFGHMWELYAMWGWFLAFASATLPAFGYSDPTMASAMTFIVIVSGTIGSLLGGVLADRFGRIVTVMVMMTLSGLCALTIGFAATAPFWLFLLIATIWGMTVIGDSAQFSAMVTEVGHRDLVGTALALQLGLGFALTAISIRLTPWLAGEVGWRWSFLLLVPGPMIGIAAMAILRRQFPATSRL